MSLTTNSGRPPLAGRIDEKTAEIVRRRYLAGASMADIGREIGEGENDVYRFVHKRADRWRRDSDFERRANARGHIVVWKNVARRTGGNHLRPITLPGTTMQRNMLAEAGR
jgi:hypothetical protein